MKLTDKQRNGVVIAALVLVLIHFAPSIAGMFRRAPQPPKPSAAHPMIVAPAVPPAPLIDPQFSGLAGDMDRRFLKPNYACNTKLELHTNPLAVEQFTAYTTAVCGPTNMNAIGKPGQPGNWVQDFIRESTPESAIFSGKIQGSSIQLHLTQAIGLQKYGCQPTNYTLTPFGYSQ